jgi:cell wall-associated NlpC family hydrolase
MIRTLVFLFLAGVAMGQTPPASPAEKKPATASLSTADLHGFDSHPAEVRELIERCLELTRLNLTYKYGSADPAQGGMDCSGTVYHVLQKSGLKEVPRTASGQYVWTRKAGTFEAVVGRTMDSFELANLKPGDLLFWTGTYGTKNDPPVSHSMIYLGERRKDRKRVMFGASDGRSYDGRKIWGVSVFDFVMPKPRPESSSTFIGYARIPGLKVAKR